MGVLQDVVGRIRGVFTRERKQLEQALELSKGMTQPQGFDTFSVYGRYGMEPLMDYLRIEQELITRFLDYAEMESYPELSAALDIYADEATQPDILTGKTMWVESDDVQIKTILQDLLDHNLQIDEEIWSIARMLCKYGNHYEEVLPTHEGVIGIESLPPETVRRYEKGKGMLVGYAQDPRGVFGTTVDDVEKVLSGSQPPPAGINMFEPWQIVHFRLLARTRPSVYGVGVLESARWIWRRLLLLEDAALIYRLTRTPTRWIFYIDVGKLPPTQALGHVRKIKAEFTKQKLVNEKGNVDLRFNALASDENIFIPVVDGKRTTEVDLMATPEWQVMDDLNYFRDKLFSAIKIPKAYLGYEEASRARLLSLEDVRFARSVMRIQRELRNGVKKICKVHLAALGIDPEKVSFDIFMTVPSWAYELAQLEVRTAKADFADKVKDYLSDRAIMKAIFGFSDEEIDAIKKEKDEEMAAMGGMEPEEPEKKSHHKKKGGTNPMDLPGTSHFPAEEKQVERILTLLEDLTKTNKGLADRLSNLREIGKDMKSNMFFSRGNGKVQMVKSRGSRQ